MLNDVCAKKDKFILALLRLTNLSSFFFVMFITEFNLLIIDLHLWSSYMRHFAPIFELDKSIFCVSAFNHLSYSHTSKDPTLAYRVFTYPAYGWMMSRAIAEFVVPKFLPGKLVCRRLRTNVKSCNIM